MQAKKNKGMVDLVLLVDDDRETRAMYSLFLTSVGFRVHHAGSGGAAMALAKREPPDIIVTDVSMPAMDGVELCRRLRADHRTQRVPIIVLTAQSSPAIRASAAAAGCDIVVEKPCLPEALARKIARLLARYRETALASSCP